MEDIVYIKSLEPAKLTEIYIAFAEAFREYPIPFKLTKEQFVRRFVKNLKMDFALSAGAFSQEGALVAFLFTTVSRYEGKVTAYNGGTGVVPAWRGRKITSRMYDYLMPLFERRGIEQCILEVLTQNDRAIRVYKGIGFEKVKYYRCFVLNKPLADFRNKKPFAAINIQVMKRYNPMIYEGFGNAVPGFSGSVDITSGIKPDDVVVEARVDNQFVGFAIYKPWPGRISLISVKPEMRRQGIGTALIRHICKNSHPKKVSVINVNEDNDDAVAFFESLGFCNDMNQYEMRMNTGFCGV